IQALGPLHFFLPDKMVQTRVANGLTKGLELVLRAFPQQLDTPVRQIPNRAGDLKAGGHRFHGIAKPDALHAARVKNVNSPAVHDAPALSYATFDPLISIMSGCCFTKYVSRGGVSRRRWN